MIVVDASALIDAFAGNAAVRRRITGEDIHAPHLLDVEVASALRSLTMSGDIAPEAAGAVLNSLSQADIIRHSHVPLLGPIWAMRHGIGAYDAAYVALAAALGAPLVTTDAKLGSAPNLPCVVEAL